MYHLFSPIKRRATEFTPSQPATKSAAGNSCTSSSNWSFATPRAKKVVHSTETGERCWPFSKFNRWRYPVFMWHKGIVKHSKHSGEQPLPKKSFENDVPLPQCGIRMGRVYIYIYIHIQYIYIHTLNTSMFSDVLCAEFYYRFPLKHPHTHTQSPRKGQTKSKPWILVIWSCRSRSPVACCGLYMAGFPGFPKFEVLKFAMNSRWFSPWII